MLTPEQVALIQTELEAALPEKEMICIPYGKLYERMQNRISMEQYLFVKCVKDSIRLGKITGFETRNGRNGGICRLGVFKEHDDLRKRSCTVTIRGKTYRVHTTEAQIFAFIVSVLDGKPTTNGENAVYIGNAAYKLPDYIDPAQILLNFMTNIHRARPTGDQGFAELEENLEMERQ